MRRTLRWTTVASFATAAAILGPTAGAVAAPKGPPPPKALDGHQVRLVTTVEGATAIAFGKGRVFIGAIGNEKTLKGAGVYVVSHGKTTRISKTPVIGLVYRGGALFGTSQNKVIAWSGWKNGTFHRQRVIFQRPLKQLPFLENIAVGPGGRLYFGTTATTMTAPLTTPYSGLVLSIKKDGSGLKTVAKGLRQPFGIAFLKGDRSPWVSNEGDDVAPFPPDFIVHATQGADFGYPGCKWFTPSDSACAGFTVPAAFFPVHSSPTGLAARGKTLYLAFFGGTTKKGPEIRSWKPSGPTKLVVRSPLPLVGLAISGRSMYFSNVAGMVYRVRI